MTGLDAADRALLTRIFHDIDHDNNGYIDSHDVEWVLDRKNIEIDGLRGLECAMKIISECDVDGDNHVTLNELAQAFEFKTNQNGGTTATVDVFVRYLAENPIEPDKSQLVPWFPFPPVFIILVTIAQIAIYVHYANEADCDNPNECPKSFSGPFSYRMCCRDEVWRFVSYGLIHASVPHIGFNAVIQMVIGLPMELYDNGPFRMAALYFCGTLAGSLGSSIFDPEANVVGASGAVYTILGAWTAHITQNWDTMNPITRWPQAIGIFLLTGLDLGNQIYKRYNSDTAISFAGHFCGFAAGVSFGTYILKNNRERRAELYIRWAGITTFVTGIVFAVFWNVFYTFDEQGICDISPKCTYSE